MVFTFDLKTGVIDVAYSKVKKHIHYKKIGIGAFRNKMFC